METKTQNQTAESTQTKTRIYNLIILDKSGSMHTIQRAAYLGCNEVLGGIRAAAEKHADDQEQFVSLLLFDSRSMPYIHKCTPAAEATDLKEKDYEPCACTPLLDAMGMSLSELEHEVDKYEDATAMVTVITDGYENASREYTYPQIHKLVGRLRDKGWNFAFMGANQDVRKVCVDLNINMGNARSFEFDEAGMRETMRKEKEAKERYFERMQILNAKLVGKSRDEKQRIIRECNNSVSYFDEGIDVPPFNKGNNK